MVTISPLSAVAVGTHLYELKHVGLTDKSKGGWHLGTTSGIGLEFHVLVHAITNEAVK